MDFFFFLDFSFGIVEFLKIEDAAVFIWVLFAAEPYGRGLV